jgi:hypothetical protein
MADRFPGGVISMTPPTVVAPVDGEGGSASGVWTLAEQLGYERAGNWPKPCQGSCMLGGITTKDSLATKLLLSVQVLSKWAPV